jgi:hypothetical protein
MIGTSRLDDDDLLSVYLRQWNGIALDTDLSVGADRARELGSTKSSQAVIPYNV